MRGFLKNGSTLFQLSSKITTIGREDCDLIVQSASVDNQHATVEYLDEKEEFYLKDLKSRFGTKVNSYTLKDNIIKLARGDKIKFGKCDLIFEFVTDSLPEISIGGKSEVPYLKKCQNLQHHHSNNSLVRVPRPPSKPMQSNSLKRPINLPQNRDTKSKSLPRNCDILTLEERDRNFSENSRSNNFDNTQFMINLGKNIESIKESVNDSLLVNMAKMDLLHELNVLKKELHLKNEEILVFKKEMDAMRTSQMNCLTFRADEVAEIKNLKQTLDECQAFNCDLKATLETLQRENHKKDELVRGLTEECEHFKSCGLNLTERNVILLKESEHLQLLTKDLRQQLQEYHELNEKLQQFHTLHKSDKEDLEEMLSKEKAKLAESTNKITDLLKKLEPNCEESVGNNITELISTFEQVITEIFGEKEQLLSELNIFLKVNEYWKELKASKFTSKKLISMIEKLKNDDSQVHDCVANTVDFLEALKTWQSSVETHLKNGGSFETEEEILDHIDLLNMEIKNRKENVSALENDLETLRAKSELDLKSIQELAEQKLQTLNEENEQKLLEIAKDATSKEEALLVQIQSLEQTKSEMSLKISEIIEGNQQEKQLLMEQVTELKKVINDLQSKQALVVDALNNDLEEFKEQVRQHSITICSQEEQILFHNQESKELRIEIEGLKHEIERLKHEIEELQVEKSHSNSLKIHSLESDLYKFKTEIAGYSILVQEKQDAIDLLMTEVHKLKIKLTDAAGELSEEHKKQVEAQLEEIKINQSQLADAHNQIEKMRKINEEMESRLLEMDDETGQLKRELRDYKIIIQKLENEGARKTSSLEHISHPVLNMSAQGSLCLQENHEETIKRQREALSKFRAKLKALEHGDLPLLRKDDAIQHVAFLRRELEELRPTRSNGSHFPTNSQIHVIGKLTKLLEISENLYLSLLNNIAKSLDLDEIIGTKSLLHCSERNLQALVEEKDQSCRQLANLICGLKEKLARNETTWRDNGSRSLEPTDVELRKSVEKLSSDMIRKKEEIMCLRQTLRETTQRLSEERSKQMCKSKLKMIKD